MRFPSDRLADLNARLMLEADKSYPLTHARRREIICELIDLREQCVAWESLFAPQLRKCVSDIYAAIASNVKYHCPTCEANAAVFMKAAGEPLPNVARPSVSPHRGTN